MFEKNKKEEKQSEAQKNKKESKNQNKKDKNSSWVDELEFFDMIFDDE